jgi:hypothetical protein
LRSPSIRQGPGGLESFTYEVPIFFPKLKSQTDCEEERDRRENSAAPGNEGGGEVVADTAPSEHAAGFPGLFS